jgi:uncharacterized protein RhaS with RHS repeats
LEEGFSEILQVKHFPDFIFSHKLTQNLKSEGGLALYSWNFSYGPLGLEKGVVKDPYNQTLLTQDYTVSTDGTILSMTYTPTGLGGAFVGELYVAYDPCGNLALMTDASGDPVASYAYDRGTRGITDVYNPSGIENLFTIAGKQVVLLGSFQKELPSCVTL